MKSSSKVAIAAAIGLSSRPCLAAAVESHSVSPAGSMAAPGAAKVEFNLGRHVDSAGLTSMTLAAIQQAASEMQDPPKRKGPGTTTLLIVGGVVFLVLVAAAVASAAPTPGPDEGAFD